MPDIRETPYNPFDIVPLLDDWETDYPFTEEEFEYDDEDDEEESGDLKW